MLKKIYKKDPIAQILVRTSQFPELKGNLYIFGRIGAGKSCLLSFLKNIYLSKGCKIFDFFGGRRNENLYCGLPSRDIDYWDKFKKKFKINEKQVGPKQFKVNYLYPFFKSHLSNKLPSNPPNVKSKIFTIPFKSIEEKDIVLIINNISEQARYLWREILEKSKSSDNGADLEDMFFKMKAENQNLYKNFIKPLVKEQFLQNENNDYNLDIIKEAKDKETISVLCLDLIPQRYHLFIMGWILRQIDFLVKKGKIGHKNVFLLREASEFFRAADESIIENKFKWFKRQLSFYMRYSREGMHFFLDTQSPNEVKGILESASDIIFLGRTPVTSKRDRAEIADTLLSFNKMSKKQMLELSDLRKGEFLIAEGYKHVEKRYIPLPRSMYWQEGDGNFYSNVWKKYVDKWINIEEDKRILNEQYIKRKEKILENRKFKIQLDKIKNVEFSNTQPKSQTKSKPQSQTKSRPKLKIPMFDSDL